ncbi:calmodulin-lysine N-methyltransferase-like [Artemia franciscana]|uniref:Calmodulin-lysine N-methyltransferase n=1 Tax=Artemia franciscana TaxID=6661 RepID=A0AA88KY27_ARTSF|nr:hypothetical protein QYM36_016338 [Artemia franciscana]
MSASKKRWKILADALLTRSISSESEEEVSVRRFRSFDLFPVQSKILDGDVTWHYFLLGSTILKIREVDKTVTKEDLAGFNNSGNVCIWPSEEILTYVCLNNEPLFERKTIIEVGGGMTCFAALAVAVKSFPKYVLCTDGNERSVQNVANIIKANDFPAQKVATATFDWTDMERVEGLRNQFDILLSADCLFFEESRKALVKAIWTILKDGGLAFIVAPARGGSLDNFISMCQTYNFIIHRVDTYDSIIANRHEKLCLENMSYNPDLHYPILLKLSKPILK